MKLKARQVAFTIVVVLVVAPILFAWFWQAKDKAAVRKYKEQLQAAGEKLTIAEILSRPPARESNSAAAAAMVFRMSRSRSGTGLLTTNEPRAMHMIVPGKAVIGWAQPAVMRDRFTNSWEEELEALSKEALPPEWIDQIIAHPVLDFQLDYQVGFELLLPHLAPLKYTATLLSMGVVGDLHRAETDAAVRKTRAILTTAQALREEQLIISQLVRFAITHIGMTATWELLQSSKVTDEQLAALQNDWSRLDFPSPYKQALLMERAIEERTFDRLRSSSREFRRLATGGGPVTSPSGNLFEQAGNLVLLKGKETAWNYAWSYPDELRSLKGLQVLLETIQQVSDGRPYFEALAEQEQRLGKLGIVARKDDDPSLFDMGQWDIRKLMSQSVLGLQRGITRVEATEVARALTVTAIALRRYRLRHGQFPGDLSALTPQFLRTIPRDPIDGKDLRYRPNADGTFLLYSIGADGVDNGGDPTTTIETKNYTWQKGRDWIWPQPATADELKAYYKSERK